MKVTYILSAMLGAILLVGCSSDVETSKELSLLNTGNAPWVRPEILKTRAVQLEDYPGMSFNAGLERLTKDPFDKDFILADVNFNQKRWFTNFSGDISGRFIEVASSVSGHGEPWPPVLTSVLDEIGKYQKEDGHFGIPVDWTKPIDFDPTTDQTVMMPLLWGNARLLLGLTTAAESFGRTDTLETAKKLGDFYVNTVYPRFCDPNRMEEYKTEGQFASAYVTCVFEGMEGLLNLYLLTQDKRYLDTACKMADFQVPFDVLPVGHSHGSLSQTSMLVRLYDVTGKPEYLQRAVSRWEQIVKEGYVNVAGSVMEKFWKTGYGRDEGCSEGDWLRLNLLLWGDTGETKYLDMAERLYWNGILPNQWNTGGFGHRFIACDDVGPFAYLKHSQESLWCCSFHVPWAIEKMLGYLAVGTSEGIWYNFPMIFSTPVKVDGEGWVVISGRTDNDNQNILRVTIEISGPDGKTIPPVHVRVPEWCDEITVLPWREGTGNEKLSVTCRDSEVPGRNILSIYTTEKAQKTPIRYTLDYVANPYLENRKFEAVDVAKAETEGLKRFDKVAFHQGPYVWMNKDSGEIQDIPLTEVLEKLSPYVFMGNKDEPHAFLFNALLPEAAASPAPAEVPAAAEK